MAISEMQQSGNSLQTGVLDPRHCIFRSVSRLARAVTVSYDAALKPSGLSAGQFTTLMTLSLNGPTTVGDLARLITANSTTIPRILLVLLQLAPDGVQHEGPRVAAAITAGLALAEPDGHRGQADLVHILNAGTGDWNTSVQALATIRAEILRCARAQLSNTT